MDAQLWRQLPDDLVEQVVAWLPVSSLCRARCVCRAWKTGTASAAFAALHAAAAAARPAADTWILMFADPHYRTAVAYEAAADRWRTLPLSFLPRNVYYVTAAGGLLCFRLLEPDGGTSMCMCNPLTGAWRKLPPMLADFYGGLVALVAGG